MRPSSALQAAILIASMSTSAIAAAPERNAFELALAKVLPSNWQLDSAPAPLVALVSGPSTPEGRMVVGVRRLDEPPGTVELFSETGRKELAAAVEARGGVLDVTNIGSSQHSGVPEITTILRGPVANAFEIRYLLLPNRPSLLVTLAGPKAAYPAARAAIEKKIVSALLELQARSKG